MKSMFERPVDANVEERVRQAILTVLKRRNAATDLLPEHHLTTHLGLDSLDVAQVVALLERELNVDPFQNKAIVSIRTLAELCHVYRRALE